MLLARAAACSHLPPTSHSPLRLPPPPRPPVIPTTLGNWFGGAVCVGTVYAFAYGRPNAVVNAWIARKKAALLRGGKRR